MANQSKLKAWLRYDGTGRVVTAGPIFQANKPKVGNWRQMNIDLCCNPSGSTTTTTTGGGNIQPTAFVVNLAFDPANSCIGVPSFILYTKESVLGPNVMFYYDAALTQPYDGVYGTFVGSDDVSYTLGNVSGSLVIINATPCSNVPIIKSFKIADNIGGVCSSMSSLTVYTPTNHLVLGNYLYTDPGMTNVYAPNIGNQFLSENTTNPSYKGIFEWNTSTGQIISYVGMSC